MAPGTTFVHDFAGVDRPVEDVLAAVPLVLTADRARELVRRVWSAESAALTSSGSAGDDSLTVTVGPARVRRDATVVPLSWSEGESMGLPSFESDLEFTAFGDDRTHVHLYGRAAISSLARAGSGEAGHFSRVAVAVVRRLLNELAAEFERTARATESQTGPECAAAEQHSAVSR